MDKILLILFIFAVLIDLIKEFLIFTNIITNLDIFTVQLLTFELFIAVAFIILIKHRYWIIAGVFLLLNTLSKIIIAILQNYALPGAYLYASILLLKIIALVCLIFSLVYLAKVCKIEDFSIKKYCRLR